MITGVHGAASKVNLWLTNSSCLLWFIQPEATIIKAERSTATLATETEESLRSDRAVSSAENVFLDFAGRGLGKLP